ncbi:hypothetical protein [Actinoplanes sp. NPDC026670]|uniref:hypothetical protein n=1 Tax=Actinoplanes sp. NPDC026670 TaxID=3154700 RepID=UPI0033F2875E
MTWPNMQLFQPYLGLVTKLPRDSYDERDPHEGRPTVVIRVLRAERKVIVVTRTSQLQNKRAGDIYHDADPALPCCTEPGLWQPRRFYRVPFAVYDDPELGVFAKMDEKLLARITEAWEGLA